MKPLAVLLVAALLGPGCRRRHPSAESAPADAAQESAGQAAEPIPLEPAGARGIPPEVPREPPPLPSDAELRARIDPLLPALGRCVASSLADAGASARFQLRFGVGADGRSYAVELAASESARRCVEGALAALPTRSLGGPVAVTLWFDGQGHAAGPAPRDGAAPR